MIVGFHEPHLCTRGTSIALYDYALANQELCSGTKVVGSDCNQIEKNKSVIFYDKNNYYNDQQIVKKFKEKFIVVGYSEFKEVDDYILENNVSYLYCIKHGMKDECVSKHVPTLVHAVFENLFSPHGIFAFVSKRLAEKHFYPWLPHIIKPLCSNHEQETNILENSNKTSFKEKNGIPSSACIIKPLCSDTDVNSNKTSFREKNGIPSSACIIKSEVNTLENVNSNKTSFREKNNIPSSAYVYGRYGGYDTFSIEYVKDNIRRNLWKHKNVYFVFVNTEKFIEHPRVMFLEKITTDLEKREYILSCDAMIHARQDGETFGLSIAEFALLQKPILTCYAITCDDNEHIRHLTGDDLSGENKNNRFVLFTEKTTSTVLWGYPHPIPTGKLPYSEFSPENVMKIFWNLMTKVV